MRLPASLLTIALILGASPAQAGWGATQWGMDVDEVLAAVAGAQQVDDERDLRVHDQPRLATSTVKQGGIDYLVSYYFGDRRGRSLTMVRVEPVDSTQCDAMRTAYEALLGPGIDQSQVMQIERGRPRIFMGNVHWGVEGSDEVIELSDVQIEGAALRFCHVLYQDHDFVAN